MNSTNYYSTSNNNIITAAIYARVSTLTQAQNGLGIDGQIDTCTKMCQLKNYKIVQIYKDEGISGTIEGHERKQFNKLLAAAKRKEFKVVVFYKLDRLGRKLKVIINIIERLVELDVKPIFVLDNIDTTTDEGMFMFNIFASVSDHELKTIKTRLYDGYMSKKMKDGDIGGIVPYGYCRMDKKISPRDDCIAIVKYIFNLADNNISMSETARLLNQYQITSPSGKGKWYQQTVKRILINKNKYSGNELINNNQNNIYWPKIL